MKISSKRVAKLGILTALALISFMIESMFPPLFLPGAKMGLSNIFTLIAVVIFSPLEALLLVLVRTTLGSFFAGNTSSLLYSMSAGIVSLCVSLVLVRCCFEKLNLVTISVISAVFHNMTQNIVYVLVTQTPQMLFFLPHLTALGVLAGLLVGIGTKLVFHHLPAKLILD